MKSKLALAVIFGAVLTGCSTIKPNDQKMSTSFVKEGVKIETKCSWTGNNCKIVAIEATGSAASVGVSPINRRTALTSAELNAKRNVATFLTEEISTTRVNTTIAKTIEKASDKSRSGKNDGETVELTDTEAKNISLRDNTSDTVSTLTETINSSSQVILKGFKKIDERVVGDREVAVTIRWSVESNEMVKQYLSLTK